MPKLIDTISENVEKYRAIRKLSIQALADKMSVHRNTVHAILNKKHGISLEMVSKLADALGVEETDLAYFGTAPEPIVIKPTPKEALKIIEEALESLPVSLYQGAAPAPQDSELSAIIEKWPTLDDETKAMVLGSIGLSEDAEERSSKLSEDK